MTDRLPPAPATLVGALDAASVAALLEHVPDGVIVADSGGVILHANAHAEALFGYPQGSLTGGRIEDLMPARFATRHADHRAAYARHPFARPMGAGLELFGARRDRTEFPVDITLGPIALATGQGVLAVVRDISERRREEEERQSLLRLSQRQGAQLRALHDSGMALVASVDLEEVLQRSVDMARDLVGARYGALAVFDEGGTILRFLTSGMSEAQRARLGDLPKGRGLLGAVLAEGRPLRISNIAADPRGVGFPPGHPPMTTFLGVPITARGRTLGNLYLTDKGSGDDVLPFDADDEAFLELIAAQIAVAADNARLHQATQALATVVERERIARELHDSLAQVLGFIRLQSDLCRGDLGGGRLEAARGGIERIDASAKEAYAEVREAILGLRSRLGEERHLAGALADYLERYRLQSGLAVELVLADGLADPQLGPAAEVQLLRIVQEAMANARKHARARSVSVRLERVEGASGTLLRTSVQDDGVGFDPGQPGDGLHYGLLTMRERAEEAGGGLAIHSAPEAGTRVVIELPLDAPQAATPSHGSPS